MQPKQEIASEEFNFNSTSIPLELKFNSPGIEEQRATIRASSISFRDGT
jgi:hypothetical protein